VRSFLRSIPGWFAFQLAEFAVLLAIAKILLALGLDGGSTFVVALVLAGALVVVNYNIRRRYLSGDDG
jgi:hypothetical protein